METNPTASAWGAEIRRRRDELGLTRAEVAEKVGVSTTMVGFWETGKNAPSSRMQAALIAELDIDLMAVVRAIADREPAA